MLTARLFTSADAYPVTEHATDRAIRFQVDRHESGAISVDNTVILEMNNRGGFRVLVGEGQLGELEEVFSSSAVPA